MPDSLVLDVPVELCLELMAPVRTDRVDAKRDLLDHVIEERNGVLLIVLRPTCFGKRLNYWVDHFFRMYLTS